MTSRERKYMAIANVIKEREFYDERAEDIEDIIKALERYTGEFVPVKINLEAVQVETEHLKKFLRVEANRSREMAEGKKKTFEKMTGGEDGSN